MEPFLFCSLSLFVSGFVFVTVGEVFKHLQFLNRSFYDINRLAVALLLFLFEVIVAGGVAVIALIYTADALSIAHMA